MYLDAIGSINKGMTRHSQEFISFVWFNLDIATSFVTINSKGTTNEVTHTDGWNQGI
jgi:hypothetical protein